MVVIEGERLNFGLATGSSLVVGVKGTEWFRRRQEDKRGSCRVVVPSDERQVPAVLNGWRDRGDNYGSGKRIRGDSRAGGSRAASSEVGWRSCVGGRGWQEAAV